VAWDYGTLQSRIADEIARSDLTSQIQGAIKDAIRHYERTRFYFNETTNNFNTVAGQEYYGAAALADIPNMIAIDSMKIAVNGGDYTLRRYDFDHIEEISDPVTSSGDPDAYCYFNKQIRLYPIPNSAATITVAYHKRFSELSASGDTNPWVDDAEELIRTRAKRNLYLHVIRDKAQADDLAETEAGLASALLGETAGRALTGLRPTVF
jgi:hypothetical protein